MSHIKYLMVMLLISIANNFHAQDSIVSDLDYYPLNNGDYWEYLDFYYNYVFPPFEYEAFNYSVEVIGDTLINNKIYKIREHKIIPDSGNRWYHFERVDSSTGNVYRYDDAFDLWGDEYLLDSLCADSGDISRAIRGDIVSSDEVCNVCINIAEDSVLNIIRNVKSFYYQCYIPGFQYRLAKGLGYIGDFNCEFTCGGTELLYAKIKGVEYGEKINRLEEISTHSIESYKVYQNYPNPFNSSSLIEFEIPQSTYIELTLYNILGEEVNYLYKGYITQGRHQVRINGSNLSSGIYFYVLKSKNIVLKMKCLLLK